MKRAELFLFGGICLLILIVVMVLSQNKHKEVVLPTDPMHGVHLYFEYEGCKVYQFTDSNHIYQYFSNCQQQTTSAE